MRRCCLKFLFMVNISCMLECKFRPRDESIFLFSIFSRVWCISLFSIWYVWYFFNSKSVKQKLPRKRAIRTLTFSPQLRWVITHESFLLIPSRRQFTFAIFIINGCLKWAWEVLLNWQEWDCFSWLENRMIWLRVSVSTPDVISYYYGMTFMTCNVDSYCCRLLWWTMRM